MEPIDIQAALESAVGQVLETMCFSAALASGDGAIAPAGDGCWPGVTAELRFHGSPSTVL